MKKNVIIRSFSAIICLVFALALFVVRCEFEKPQSPSWDTEINMPLVNKTYTMSDFAGESKHLYIDTVDSLLGFRIDGVFDTTKIGESLRISNFDGRAGVRLGDITLGNLGEPQSDQFRFDELWPPASQSYAPVPAFTIPPGVTSALQFDNSFRMASIFDGVAEVTARNDLPVDFQELSLTLWGYDAVAGADTVIGSVTFSEGINSGGQRTAFLDLTNKDIPSMMFWEIAGFSPGSTGQNVQIIPADAIHLETAVASLTVVSALAKIPPIDFDHDQVIAMPEGVQLNEARFLSGLVRIHVTNNTDLGAALQLTLPDLQRISDGRVLVDSLDMGARTVDSLFVPLRFFRMAPALAPVGQNQTLQIGINGHTKGTGENFISVTRNDSISVNVSFVNIKLAYMRGVLPEQTVTIDSFETALNLPAGLEKFQFSRALLVLDLLNTVGLPMRVDGVFVGIGSRNQEIAMPLQFEIQPGSPNNPARTLVPFNQNNSNIVALLNQVPEKVLFYGTASYGDGFTASQLTHLDYFLGHFMFTTPFEFAWEADTVQFDSIKIIVTPEDADQSLRDAAETQAEEQGGVVLDGDLTSYLQTASIRTTVMTRLPIGMDLVFKISEDSSGVPGDPEVIAGPLQIPQGPPGRSAEPVTLASDMELSESDFAVFKNRGDTLKNLVIRAELIISGTGGEFVQVYASDFLTVESMAVIIATIDLEEEGNKR